MKLELNHSVPDFQLIDDENKIFRLYDVDTPLLIVFYPGDETPVCTAQLCDYNDGIPIFRDLGVDIVGISKDSIESHQKFKKKHNFQFRLLTDPDGNVAQMFGCKTLLGTINRAVFLIGKNKELLWFHKETLSLFRRKKEELLEVIKKLKQENKI